MDITKLKKTIGLLVLIIATLSFFAPNAGAKIGDYAGPRCDTGMVICEDESTERLGPDRDRFYMRIHNLEVLVEQQKQQIKDLQSRASLIEDVVDELQTRIIRVLQTVLAFLSGITQMIIK